MHVYTDRFGITALTTNSATCSRNSSTLIFSLCCVDTTTVCTRKGTAAPFSKRYSHVTCDGNYHKQENATFRSCTNL